MCVCDIYFEKSFIMDKERGKGEKKWSQFSPSFETDVYRLCRVK